ncbi:BAX protein [hydrothermal vent metagenome]|uniref:BAX protein n=1 Tax=hydrothermal vent metagenome TaxID=652676 RepID=A0A1W1C984_9ZZZZ
MFNQRRIIKTLLMLTVIQLTLFIAYYIYNNFIKRNKSSVTPHKFITEEQTTPPESIALDKPTIQIVAKRVIKERPEEKLIKKLRRIAPTDSQDIVAINSSRVKPILYTNSVPLSSLSIPQKKQKFIDMMIPSILVAKHHMRRDKERVSALIIKHDISPEDKKWLEDKRKEFKAVDNYELYDKMESHPTSIVIAQAIVESGWGSSKFFQKANNVFGVWSFSKKDNRMAASKKRGKRTIYLKKYKNMEESIYDYFVTLARKDTYKLFQKKRLITEDPYKLVNYLVKYSERGKSYTKELKDMIKKNKLSAYDKCKLDL